MWWLFSPTPLIEVREDTVPVLSLIAFRKLHPLGVSQGLFLHCPLEECIEPFRAKPE